MRDFFVKIYFLPLFSSDNQNDDDQQTGTITVVKTELSRPKMFKVLMHNDDYTTMEFVIAVLKKFFNKTDDQAHDIMMKVHLEGLGICGIYTYEIAESKSEKVNKYSRDHGHPLTTSFEPCEP